GSRDLGVQTDRQKQPSRREKTKPALHARIYLTDAGATSACFCWGEDPIPTISRPTTAAIWRTCTIRSSNCSGNSDCMPSDSALSGWLCTSTISPSAPTATDARDRGVTLLRFPVPWLGSTTIGKWLSHCTAGTMLRSSVLRV